MAGIDQVPQFPVETVERGSTANHGGGLLDMLVQGGGALELRAAEAQAADARKPLGVDVENEKQRPICEVVGQEIVRFPGVDRDHGVLAERPGVLEHFDAAWRAADMKNQMPLAMRVDVEGTIELVDGRTTEMAVKHGKSPNSCTPPANCVLSFFITLIIRGKNASPGSKAA